MNQSSNSARSGTRGTIPKVLIVSADAEVVDVARDTLNGEQEVGIQTEPNGVEAARLLGQNRYAAIIFDDTLHQMNAIEFAFYVSERARRETRAVAVGTHPPTQSSVLRKCGIVEAHSTESLHHELAHIRAHILGETEREN